MSIDEVKRKTTARQFLKWQRFILQIETKSFHREDYYAALIASEVRRSWVKYPRRVKLSQFILDFQPKGSKRKDGPQTEEEAVEHVRRSKAYWLTWAGVDDAGQRNRTGKTRSPPSGR